MAVFFRLVFAVGLGLGLGLFSPGAAQANWLTHILKEAGEAGGKGTLHAPPGLGSVGKAFTHLKGLDGAPKGALAAHATPEGHWQFANRDGQVFTAGTADEMARVLPTLAPDAGDARLTLYLSEDSVFANRAALDQIPLDAELHVVTDRSALPISRTGGRAANGADDLLAVRLKPNLKMVLTDRRLFDEANFVLGRPLNKANIRTVALEEGGQKALKSAPGIDGASKLPLVDSLDPSAIGEAFQRVRGQSVLLTGRVDGGRLYAESGVSVDLAELGSAARRGDVNLIILRNDTGRQAGGRNWLWQKIEVGGLKRAGEKASFGDFLDALAAERGGFAVEAADDGIGRIRLNAVPDGDPGIVAESTSMLGDIVSHVTGEVITKSIEIAVRDQEAQMEYDLRLIPGVPSRVQGVYFAGLIGGVLGWATARNWWMRLWPPSVPNGANRLTRFLRRTVREILYFVTFLPIVGVPAVVCQVALQMWNMVSAPFRWFRRKFLARTA